jgi:hypothetical protein
MNREDTASRLGARFEEFVGLVAPSLVEGAVSVITNAADEGFGADIIIEGSGGEVTLVEVKSDVPSTETRLSLVIEKLRQAGDSIPKAIEVHRVVATPGVLADERVALLQKAGIELWDGRKLVAAAKLAGVPRPTGVTFPSVLHLEKPPDMILRRRLNRLAPGPQSWSGYQELCQEVLSLLFHPPLEAPFYESRTTNGHNRRDIVLPNYVESGFWQFMRTHYGADFVVVDAKNSGRHIQKADVLQLANYLSSHGAGLFGMCFVRKGADKGALWTIREQWVIHRKLIVVVNDKDVFQMLTSNGAGNDPASVIRQKIEDFRLGL